MELLELLHKPGKEYSPVPFWFLNGNLTHARIRSQLMDFYSHGVYGVILHPRMGLSRKIGYLSRSFFSYIRTAVQTAAELGMTVVFYDEGMYPSGSANGQVVSGHPEYASQGITLVSSPRPGDEILARTEAGVLVARPSGGTIRGIHWGEDDGEANAPASADILNPEAVRRFIELTHEAYYSQFKEYFGTTVLGFFTDEPSILGRSTVNMFPWTKGFAAVFTAAGGDLAGLTALFCGEENGDTRLYRQMLLEREEKVYYGALSQWCADHGVALMGHPDQSDDIEVERFFHIPGQDLVYRFVAPEKGGLGGAHSTQAKCSADAARLMNRRRNANECFGACNRDDNPWYLPGEDIKWFLDWLAVRGVNMFIPHAFYYSIDGRRKNERPPDVGPHSIWWPHYKQWACYMSRLSCLMTDAELHAEVAVLCRNRALAPELVAPLFRSQIGFQYLPQSLWEECEEQDGALLCRGHRYRAVLGAEGKFMSVSHDATDIEPDCRFSSPQPELRTAYFTRAGVECWLLVNEGEKDIETDLTLPTDKAIGQYDLWNGKLSRFSGRLKLPRRGSLLFFSCEPADYIGLPDPVEPVLLPTPAFSLSGQDARSAIKEYDASLTVDAETLARSSAVMEFWAEEMAELYVNGVSVGVGFWPPQRFDLRPYLKEGKNSLRLIVTGSPANRYGRPVPYGLMRDKNVLPAQCFRPVLYLAGDSTMQSYKNDANGLCGWGQMLAAEAVGGALCGVEHREDCPFSQERRYLLPDLILDNCAMAGRSLRTFASEGRLADIEKHLQPGDFLLVQFVHNDCDPAHPERFEPLEEFVDEMKRYSSAAKDKGAQPILVTPVPWLSPENCPAQFSSYVEAIREFACREDIPCLDLTAEMEASLSCLGNRRSGLLYQPDGVHLTVAGAKHAAHIAAQMLRESVDERLSLLRRAFR